MPPPPGGDLFADLVGPAPTPAPAPAPAPAGGGDDLFADLVSAPPPPPPPPTIGQRALGYVATIPATMFKVATLAQRAVTGVGDLTGLMSPSMVRHMRADAAMVDRGVDRWTRDAPGATGASGLAATIAPFLVPGVGPVLGAGLAGGEGINAAREKGFSRPAALGVGAAKAAILRYLPGGIEAGAERLLAPGILRGAATGAGTAGAIGGADAAVTATYDPKGAWEEAKSIPLAMAGFGALGGVGRAMAGRNGPETAPEARVAPTEAAHAAPVAPTDMFADLVGGEAPPARAVAAPAAAEPAAPARTALAPVSSRAPTPYKDFLREHATELLREPAPVEVPPEIPPAAEPVKSEPVQELPPAAEPISTPEPAPETAPAPEAPVTPAAPAPADPLAAFDAETRQRRIATQKRINELRADQRANPAPNPERSRRLDYESKTAKGDAMQRAAERRKLVQGDDLTRTVEGGLTGKELTAARQDAVAMKGPVTTPEGPGHVVGVVFGKVRVKLASGETKSFERAHVQRVAKPVADSTSIYGTEQGSNETTNGAPRSVAPAAEASNAGRGRAAGDVSAPAEGAPAAVPAPAAGDRAARATEPVAGEAVGARPPTAVDRPAVDRPGHTAPASAAPGEPAANQRATSTRPDLAIPTDRPEAREVFKAADAERTTAGEPAVVSRAATREAAAERLSADFAGEHAKLRAKIDRGDALNAEEAVMGRVIVERLTESGDLAEAVHAADLYRRGGTESGRALGIRHDPLERPHERTQRNVREALLDDQRARTASLEGDTKRHAELLAKHAAEIHDVRAKVEHLTGIDPLALDQPVKPKAQRRAPTKATLDIDREYTDLAKKLKEAVKSALKGESVGSTGGEVADVLVKIIVNRLKKGALKAGEMAATLARLLPDLAKNAKLQEAFKAAWNKVKPDEPITDVAALFKPSLDEQVAAAEKRRAAALERHKEAFGQTPEERLAKLEAKEAAKAEIPEEVRAINAEIAALGKQVRNRDRAIAVNARRVIDAIATIKADRWDKVYEYRRNVVHTSLKLPLKKVASDILNTLHHALVDWFGRPLANKLPGGEDTASFTDAKYVIRGLLPGLRDGIANGWKSWVEQRNVWQDELHAARTVKAAETGESFQDEFHQPRALTGKLGAATGWNLRAVGAFQSFAETLLARLQVGAEAYRRAFDTEGNRLTGDALEQHMHRETSDLSSESWTQADTTAKDITGVTPHKTGPVAWLNKLANLKPKNAWERTAKELIRHAFLFRTLPFNFMVKGIYHMTPLNGLTLLARGAKSLTGLALRKEGWTYKRAQFNTDIAKHAMGWAGLLIASELIDDEKGDPRITGFEKWTPSAADVPLPLPHSIKLFGKWHDYSGLGPVGHALGLYADVLRGVKHWRKGETGPKATEDVLESIKDQAVNDTWMRTIRDIDEAFSGGTSAGKFVGSMASSFYPTMFKDLGKATQAHPPDRQVKEHGFWDRASQVAAQQLSIHGWHAVPSVDIFGREVEKDGEPTTLSSFIVRATNPFEGPKSPRDDIDGYRMMIVRWNEEHPTEKLLPKAPEPWVTIGRKRHDLTEQQYHDLCVDAGERVLKMLQRTTLDTDNPTPREIRILKAAVSTGQAAARGKLKATIWRESRPASSTSPASSDSSRSSPGTP